MKELYKVPIGKQYVAVVWEVANKRHMAVFDVINGNMSPSIEV